MTAISSKSKIEVMWAIPLDSLILDFRNSIFHQRKYLFEDLSLGRLVTDETGWILFDLAHQVV